MPEESEIDKRDVEKPAMEILEDEGKRRLAAIMPPGPFADRAGRRIEKERAIVCLAVVVASRPKSERASQNQKRRRKPPPVVCGIDQRRIERREIGAPLIKLPL